MLSYFSKNKYLSNEELLQNARCIFDYLTNTLGWTQNAACGLLGNTFVESKHDPGLWQGFKEGNTKVGYGIVQWTPASKYLNWAEANGYDPAGMEGQLLRLKYEMDNNIQYFKTASYPLTFKQFISSKESPDYLAKAFLYNYERPANPNFDLRAQKATEYYKLFHKEEESPKVGFSFKNIKWDKTNLDLVAYAKQLADYENDGKNKQPYWYGTCGYWCTEDLYKKKKVQYPEHYPVSMDKQRKEDIANGRIATDCIGVFKGYAWWDAKQNKANKNSNMPDTTATGLYNLCKIKGPINTIPEVPGLCVWRSGHIGVYIGNGEIVEARGRHEGVIVSTIKTTNFTNWGVVPFIFYAGYEHLLQPVSLTGKNAVVNTKGAEDLNLWSDTQKTTSKKKVAKGETVYVKQDLSNGWVIAQYNGAEGYVDAKYLVVSTVAPIPDPVEEPDVKEGPLTGKHAIVNTKYDAGLNLWKYTGKKESIIQIAKGQVVFVKTDLSNGWVIAEFNGKTGYIDSKYLVEVQITPEPKFKVSGLTLTITCNNQEQLDAAIDYINDKFEEE